MSGFQQSSGAEEAPLDTNNTNHDNRRQEAEQHPSYRPSVLPRPGYLPRIKRSLPPDELELYQRQKRIVSNTTSENKGKGKGKDKDKDGAEPHWSKFGFTDDSLVKYLGGDANPGANIHNKQQQLAEGGARKSRESRGKDGRRDIISAMCQNIELAVELGKHLNPEDILTLYSVSRDFNHAIKGYLLSSILTWIGHRCPEAGRMFPFKIYRAKLVEDPRERTWGEQYTSRGEVEVPKDVADEVRVVPGLKYLQMVMVRDRCCHEIIAIMARNGHRFPKTMYATLLRLWVLMDVATSYHRRALVRNATMWPDIDLYNAQLFFVKLSMHFNDPATGPGTNELVHLILGQKGLYPLWQLLFGKKHANITGIIDLKTRYDMTVPESIRRRQDENPDKPRYFHGVPLPEVGRVHLEGWGTMTDAHLSRPDELIPVEAVERGLDLRRHLRHMVCWGYFDWQTGENLVPTEEEMYISDEERKLSCVNCSYHWKKRHVLKKRWNTLTPEQQQEIKDEEEDDALRALAWAGMNPEDGDGSDDDDDDDDDDEPYDINNEIDRGLIVPLPGPGPYGRSGPPDVPVPENMLGWVEFVNNMMMSTTPEADADEALRAQSTRDHLKRRRAEQKRDLFAWRAWLETPEVAARVREIREARNAAQRQAGEAATRPAGGADGDGDMAMTAAPPAGASTRDDGLDGDYDGDVEMEE